jgi:hypothetical protein
VAQADLAGSAPLADQLAEPTEAERRALVERFAAAIDMSDVAGAGRAAAR